ncbi:hypothetical protein [Clostridium beijerinckii]|uniref:hypothetical protein n=1 Tax=Clostridium beijerinckii TaxID=1520 RepID=UPI000809F8E4|nr:hypothetical protein [Clostridium beijerinckii]OCB00127.1 hypothetical protein BGS1_12810 [Clostridium beijerinckii]
MISTEKILTDFIGHIVSPTGFNKERKLELHEMVGCIILLCSKANITFLEYIELEHCPKLLKLIYNNLRENEYYKKYIDTIDTISKYNTLIDIKEIYKEAFKKPYYNYYLTDLRIIDDVEKSCLQNILNIKDVTNILKIDAAYKILKNRLPKNKYKNCSTYIKHNDIFFFSYNYVSGNYLSNSGRGSETKENEQYFCYKLKCISIIPTIYSSDSLFTLFINSDGLIFIDPIKGTISVDEFLNIYKDVFEFESFAISYNDENPLTEKGFYSILNLILNTMRDDRVTIKINNVMLPENLYTLGIEVNFTEDELKSINEKYIPLDSIKLIELKEEQLQTSTDLLFFNFNDFSRNYFNRNLIITEISSILTYAYDRIFFSTNFEGIVIFILGCKERENNTMNVIDELYCR